MGITDLYSKRQRRARGEMPDVLQYDTLPAPLRVQVTYILADLFTPKFGYNSDLEEAFDSIHHALCREYGLVSLSESHDPRAKYGSNWAAVIADFAARAEPQRVLDLIEASLQEARRTHDRGYGQRYLTPKLRPEDAITELNTRFKEHGVGFQYEQGEIIRVDSRFLHAEAVKPALAVLSEKRFAGADAEFLKAHEHYRHSRHAEAMNECLKSLESCLKVICKERNWQYKETDTANTLLNIVFTQGLVPDWLQSEFGALRSTVESGVPTVRNRLSGHGAGAQPRQVPEYFASYLLHLTAAAIVFLAKADEATR